MRALPLSGLSLCLLLTACRGDEGDKDSALPIDDCAWYVDGDGDGFGADDSVELGPCDAPPDGWVAAGGDCDDDDGSVNPAAEELCDARDNDCDGEVDEGLDTTWYQDQDGDGYGDAASPVQACAQPAGAVADATDCDDTQAEIYPGAAERCDGLDNDCDGVVDEDLAETWYQDQDGDGYGDPAQVVEDCNPGAGWLATAGDCDDQDPAIHPEAEEICNDADDDCDGEVDEGLLFYWYYDGDGDGFGDAATGQSACDPGAGWVELASDCDDNNSAINPLATEVCNTLDDDCDGLVDDADPDVSGTLTWYADGDGDGYGDPDTASLACTQPSGMVEDGSDCDDGDADVNPIASEYCNGVDDDCDGAVDEDSALDAATWYQDGDGDGYGEPDAASLACTQPSGTTDDSSDCDDSDAASFPGALETLDGADNDCDGDVDEAVVATVFASQCLLQWGSSTYTSAQLTTNESDALALYLDDMDLGMDRFDETSSGWSSATDLSGYALVLYTKCGWAWSSSNQAMVDALLDVRDAGISTFLFGDDITYYDYTVTGEESLTLMPNASSNGTAGTVNMAGVSHDAYAGPYGTPVDFAYGWDMDKTSVWGNGETVLATHSAYGTPVWAVYEDSTNDSRGACFLGNFYAANHGIHPAAAQGELEIMFKNTVAWLLAL